MCEAVSADPFGNPLYVPLKSTVAAVMLPAESFVRLNVIVIVPEAPASALMTAGTSLVGSSVAVNFGAGSGVGAVGEVAQALMLRARMETAIARRFINRLLEDQKNFRPRLT